MNALASTVVVLVAALGVLLSPTQAGVVVYTDRAAWETSLNVMHPSVHFHDQNFEETSPGPLATGINPFPFLAIGIPGTVGFNAIDNSSTYDPFNDALSPNGSTYYLGDVNIQASDAPVLRAYDLDFAVAGFGADWVVDGELFMEIQGTLIPFDTYLPPRSGFLGITTTLAIKDASLKAYLSGSAAFGMDDVRTGNILPEPSATALSCSVWLVLCAFRRRRSSTVITKRSRYFC